jgi:uncharacterized protein (TIGR02246 family)
MNDGSEIETLYRRLLDSWNRRDAAAYAALFDEDAHLVGFDGSMIGGRREIAPTLAKIFADHPTQEYVPKIREVRFLSPEVAMLRAVAGMVPRGQSDIDPRLNAVQTMVALKCQGEWRIVLFQNTPAAFHGRPHLVEQLTEELREALRSVRS